MVVDWMLSWPRWFLMSEERMGTGKNGDVYDFMLFIGGWI